MRRFITTKELCEVLHVSHPTIKRWVKEGIITPAFSMKRGWRFDLDETLTELGVGQRQPPRETKFLDYDPEEVALGTTVLRLLKELEGAGLSGEELRGMLGRKLKDQREKNEQ